MLVSSRMTRDPVAVSPDDSLAEALRVTRARRIRHLPVVRGAELVGIVSDRDVRLAMPSPLTEADPARVEFLNRTKVGSVMTREVVTVGPRETVEDAARILARHRIGAVPVVDAHGALVGILSETDILHAFVELLGPAGASSRIEIALPDRPGALGRALRIIGEELGINVGAALVPPGSPGETRRIAILHLSTIDPREALAALEAAEFEVGWPSLDADLRRDAPR
jgi:acetoin utilization protein AcuB